MARVVGNMVRAPAMFGPGNTGLFGSVTSSRVGFVGVGQMGRSFSGVVACATPAQTTRKPRGIMRPRPITPEFEEFVGAPEISRTQALKVIWAHIKANDLQDPNNKKIIICDEKLKKIFAGKERVGFLEIAGLISPHLL